MSALYPPTFYRKPPLPGTLIDGVRFGPFPVDIAISGTNLGLLANVTRPVAAPQGGGGIFSSPASTVRQQRVFEGVCRAARFPGVMATERPARGAIVFPLPAVIGDLSTLTISDGFSGFIWTFYRTTPFVAGLLNVDLTAAVTAADCAAAFAAATLLAFPIPGGGTGGFQARADGALVRMIQASTPKTLQSALPTANSTNLSWFNKTSGSLGNGPIIPSAPANWTGAPGFGSLVPMEGGKYRRPGVVGLIANRQRSAFLPIYFPAIAAPE